MRSTDKDGAVWRHYLLVGAALAVSAAGAAVVIARMKRVVVVGESMMPTLESGDRLIVVRTRAIRAGDVVALNDPRDAQRQLVKRVRTRIGDSVQVVGDNDKASTDSRHFGAVPLKALTGRVFYRYLPEIRRGRL